MLRSLFRQRLVIAVLFISLMTMSQSLTMLPRTAFADTINPGVLDIGATLGGLTYGQWSEKWWQWAYSVTTPTFDDCPNQSGQTWFLNGAFKVITGTQTPVGSQPTKTTVRNCPDVPAGKNIMFPLFNFEQSVVEAQSDKAGNLPKSTCPLRDVNGKLIKGTGYASLLRCAKAFTQHVFKPGASLGAEVDGKALKSLTHYRASSPPPLFPFTAINGNPIGLCETLNLSCPLTTKAASDGFWIILGPGPLPTGTHTIHFTAVVPFPDAIPSFIFTSDVTYNLIVK